MIRSQARRVLGWLAHPAAIPSKVRRWLGRRRAMPAYREALTHNAFVVEAGPLPSSGLISVAMPVYRVSEAHLRAAIASVAAQSWPDWELVAVNDASPDPHVARVLAEAASNPRVRVVTRATNGGISLASNDAVARARGEFVAFLDHDDLLHPRALELAARFLGRHPEVDWLFTDEDKVDEQGRHDVPCLKPGWSRHVLLSFNYVCHLRVIRKAMIESVGGHRPAFDGAQDYDLALRILAAGGRFAHLAGILYHWRTVPASMATAASAKPAAHERALRALREHAATFPAGGEPSARVLIPAGSFFEVRRPCLGGARVAVADFAGDTGTWVGALGRTVEILDPAGELSPESLVGCARRTAGQFLVVAPRGGVGTHDLEELLALLQVPGTALAAGRRLKAKRVESSGWVATDSGTLWDPWRHLPESDPGYLNLAMIPGARLVPPPVGFAVSRDAVLRAWDAAPDVAPAWRLPAGWARLGLEVVTSPWANLPGGSGRLAVPPAPPPPDLPSIRFSWLAALGLVEAPPR